MNVDKYASKLKNLKRKRINLTVKNRKEMNKEEKLNSINRKPAVYSMNEEPEEGGSGSADKKEHEDQKTKLFGYSIRDYEQWQNREDRKVKMDSSQYRDLAKSTYDKEVQRMVQKEKHHNRIEKQRFKVNSRGKLEVKDDPNLVNELAESLNQTASERFLRTRKKIDRQTTSESSSGFVNVKNKQFNDKLDRQAKKAGHRDSD
ncbi:LANO_0H21176g1_1 [Lachancea nothofagi CBS 11611]|uniref:Pre-mRNA-splicing factor SYF2 n=1 Tax=Lachancea nothofagi CBS 11611 TaxID=1266666 RepID=A0A1G4KNC2_9SACH|nr:LANO_0H21176g1_1 [Lachancea nothofagi CBS 11611]